MGVELGVIGEVTATVDGGAVNLGPARQRCVIAVLAVEAEPARARGPARRPGVG